MITSILWMRKLRLSLLAVRLKAKGNLLLQLLFKLHQHHSASEPHTSQVQVYTHLASAFQVNCFHFKTWRFCQWEWVVISKIRE